MGGIDRERERKGVREREERDRMSCFMERDGEILRRKNCCTVLCQ